MWSSPMRGQQLEFVGQLEVRLERRHGEEVGDPAPAEGVVEDRRPDRIAPPARAGNAVTWASFHARYQGSAGALSIFSADTVSVSCEVPNRAFASVSASTRNSEQRFALHPKL
jgi:hypothetical protein